MHTSPLAQPGLADAGGMNVYVRQLASALARSGSRCEVFTRREGADQPASTWVEPGFRVHHVKAGPLGQVPKEALPDLVGQWTSGVGAVLDQLARRGEGVELVHANYWLSGMAGHALKHAMGLPLVTTFHTLERVKAQAGESEEVVAERRSAGEAAIVGCSDAVLASCPVEAGQLVGLYGADAGRVEVVPPGVDRAFFSPGDQSQARRAVGLPVGVPIVLFVGRVQPLKGLVTAASALALLSQRAGRAGAARLVVVGGPSGPQGGAELAAAMDIVAAHGVSERVSVVAPQPHEMLSTYYRAADVCIVPSRSESFGLVALEAAASGIPVVASAVGGLSQLVDHGRTGYLVGPRDVRAFAHYLGELLDDRSLARLLGVAALGRSAAYTWSAAARRLERLSEVLARRELLSCS